MNPAADYWIRLIAAEARRKQLAGVTHEMRAKVQARVSANDEPESPAMRAIREAGQQDARAVMRTILRARDLNDAEQRK